MTDTADRTDARPLRRASLSSVLEGPAAVRPPAVRLDRLMAARIGILAGLFIALHYWLIDWMVRLWLQNANWQHGFLIPLFSLYLLYAHRQELLAARPRGSNLGLALMLAALPVEAVTVFPIKIYWLTGLAMVVMLLGLVLYLGGPSQLRHAWLPVAFLALAVPLPDPIYTRMAYPLQEVAAWGSTAMLNLFGLGITQDASHLSFLSRTLQPCELTVAEACSGMRLLMAFFALGVATAYLENRPVWQRVVLVLACIPIAVFCNVLRVAITCFMFYIDQKELGEGVLHSFTGMLMLIPAFLMLYGLSWLLRKLFVEEDDSAGRSKGEPAPQGGQA